MSETSPRRPTVAVVGASSDRRKFGNKSVRAHAAAGFDVFPVHPTETTVEGLACVRTLADVPAPLDRVSVYLPPAVTLGLLESWAAVSFGEVWLNPGADAAAVVARAQELGLRVVCACSIVDVGFAPAQFADA